MAQKDRYIMKIEDLSGRTVDLAIGWGHSISLALPKTSAACRGGEAIRWKEGRWGYEAFVAGGRLMISRWELGVPESEHLFEGVLL